MKLEFSTSHSCSCHCLQRNAAPPLPTRKPDLHTEQSSPTSKKDFCLREQTYPEDRWLVIQRCIRKLVHASDCRETNCLLRCCQKLKEIVQHDKVCDGCQLCRRFVALCYTHAKQCKETKCPVPHCVSTKQISYLRRLHENPINKRRLQLIKEKGNPEVLGNIVRTFIRLQNLFEFCKIATSK
ncbi:hypothetical protein TNIN_14971 [Trichonephila inaurata madagascariensis]|uniref:histone acetyltransferase n=1 Tax=Trichonephila inaurata madagascariensis TaxID=2747483 RepID=A0A8X6MDF5_9ARAC|nr:hypothetical protein TNIN_14971 [Trichonephila inaurata madagascariensis]